MPQGYYTIEQWKRSKRNGNVEWVPVLTLPFGGTLTAAEKALAQLGKPGFYRVVQTQRVIWAERDGKNLRLRKSHADSPDSLDRIRQMFERCGGRYPLEEVRETRRQSKKKKAINVAPSSALKSLIVRN